MNYFLCAFRAALLQRFHSRSSRVFALLAAILTVCMLFAPEKERLSAVEVGIVPTGVHGERLLELLQERSSQAVCFIRTDERTMDQKILSGEWDCGLVLSEDFDERLEKGKLRKLITVKTGPASTVYPLVQESVAACMMELMSPYIAAEYLEVQGMDSGQVMQQILQLQEQSGWVEVKLETSDGQPLQPPELTSSGASRIFRGLIGLFTLIWGLYVTVDLGTWLKSETAVRLGCVRSVFQLLLPQLTAALLPVCLWGGLVLTVLGESWITLAGYGVFLLLVLSLGLLLPRFAVLWQSVIALIPFIAVFSLLLEPVLLDTGALFPVIGKCTRILPVTLFLRSCDGDGTSLLFLAGEAVLLMTAGLLADRKKR